MRVRKLFCVGLPLAAAFALALAGHAIPLLNAGFEAGGAVGDSQTLLTGSAEALHHLPGWEILGQGVKLKSGLWQAAEGARFVTLLGQSGIRQDVQTVVGERYEVRFALAGDPEGGPESKLLRVAAVATHVELGSGFRTHADYAFDVTGHTPSAMGWIQPAAFVFTATHPVTTLSFVQLGTSPFGAAIDAIDVRRQGEVPSPIPEPGTALLLAAGALGLGALRRR